MRCHETPHRHQIQVLRIGKMCLVWCILLISITKRNRLRFHAFLTCTLLFLLLIQCKRSLYLGPVRRCGVSWHPYDNRSSCTQTVFVCHAELKSYLLTYQGRNDQRANCHRGEASINHDRKVTRNYTRVHCRSTLVGLIRTTRIGWDHFATQHLRAGSRSRRRRSGSRSQEAG